MLADDETPSGDEVSFYLALPTITAASIFRPG